VLEAVITFFTEGVRL